MLNRVILMGRLTRDPELRHTQNGIAVASFTLAVDRDFGSKDGQEKQTDFIDIVAWRNTAEFVSRYFNKGRMAVVEGRLQIRPWEDKDGNKRRNAEIVADNIYFADSKRTSEDNSYGGNNYAAGNSYSGGGSGYSAPAPQRQTYTAPQTNTDYGGFDVDESDLPF